MMNVLKIKEKSLLKKILKEHQLGIQDELKDSNVSKKDKQCLKKEYERVDDIIHKLGL